MHTIISQVSLTQPTMGPSAPTGAVPTALKTDAALRLAAQNLEATFLSEMLKSAGLGETRGSFGGGLGEEQFASFLRDEQAKAMTKAGGIGLAESLYRALKENAYEE